MENILNKINDLFNSEQSDEKLKEIYNLISDIKEGELDNIFGFDNSTNKDSASFSYASITFNSLFLILHNINFFEDKDKKHLFKKISNICYDLFYSSHKTNLNIDNLLFLGLYGIISERVVDIDNILHDHLKDYSFNNNITNVGELGVNVKYLILNIFRKIKQEEEAIFIKELSEKIKNQLFELQDNLSELEELENDALELVGYSNIIYISDLLVEFLVSGKNESGTSILSSIDIYCKNSIDAFKGAYNSFFVNISYLLKFTYNKLYDLSVWTFLISNPLFKDYFNKLNSGNGKFLSFFPSQRKALNDLFNYGKKAVILTMPTSAGKSILAELYLIFNLKLAELSGSVTKPLVAYIVPTNSLLNQVKRDLIKKVGYLGYKVDSIIPMNSIDNYEKQILSDIDILVTTPEKLDFLIRNKESIIDRLNFVIMDEAHNIGDSGRGSKFELVLSIIKEEKSLENRVNFLLLSPFIENSKNIGTWLGDTEDNSTLIQIDWSPTKQFTGTILYGENKSTLEYLPSPRGVLYKNKKIVFTDTKESIKVELFNQGVVDKDIKEIYKTYLAIKNTLSLETILIISESTRKAELITKNLLLLDDFEDFDLTLAENKNLVSLIDIIKLEYDVEENDLIKGIKKGVIFHHAQMPDIVKKEIENLILEGKFRVICSTTTLGQGVNFPIRTVVFDTLYPGRGEIMSPTIFWNIAGRAGRAFIDKDGHILTLQKSGSQKGTRKVLQSYIDYDTKKLLSSLTKFFDDLGQSGYEIDYEMVRKNPTISNFLQYINHVIYDKYNYDFDRVNQVEIRKILSSSLIYVQLTEAEGFESSQNQISSFVESYIERLKNRVLVDKSEGQLKKADKLSISDISLKNITGLAIGLKGEIGEHSTFNIVLRQDTDKLGRIINILNAIPELRLNMSYEGEFKPDLIAEIVIGWVNGSTVKNISIKTGLPLNQCYKYINSQLRNFITWGISIYQQINHEREKDNNILPSFIYYGVNNNTDLILSLSGVPRFALNIVKRIFSNKGIYIQYNIENIPHIRDTILNFLPTDYTKESYKEIIDKNIK